MAFLLKKEVSLEEFGWKDCKLIFNAVTFQELKDFQKKAANLDRTDPQNAQALIDLLLSKFVEGSGLKDKGEKESITKDNLPDLPFEVLLKAVDSLMGASPDPNS